MNPIKNKNKKTLIIAISVEMVGKPPNGQSNGGYGPLTPMPKIGRPPVTIMAMIKVVPDFNNE
jgi:hypothetical protein